MGRGLRLHLFLKPQEPAFVSGLHQFMNKRCGGDKTDRQAFLACRQPEAKGNVGFAQGNRISKVYQERTQEIVVPSSAFKFDTV